MGINISPSVVPKVSNGLRDCSTPGFGVGLGSLSCEETPKTPVEAEILEAALGMRKIHFSQTFY